MEGATLTLIIVIALIAIIGANLKSMVNRTALTIDTQSQFTDLLNDQVPFGFISGLNETQPNF